MKQEKPNIRIKLIQILQEVRNNWYLGDREVGILNNIKKVEFVENNIIEITDKFGRIILVNECGNIIG